MFFQPELNSLVVREKSPTCYLYNKLTNKKTLMLTITEPASRTI